MLLDAVTMDLAPASDAVLARLSPDLRAHTGPETHASVIEFRTHPHPSAWAAIEQLASLRERLSRELAPMGLRAACAGTYPLRSSAGTRLSTAARYRAVGRSMRSLARRPPTMALHVHVGVPDAEDAVRVLAGLRRSLPVLIALSANSPFCEGRDGGFASERAALFHAFPRTGVPRLFGSYAEYVQAIDPLIGAGAISDVRHLWWDVRLQPAIGTVEVRAMDSQCDTADVAPLTALVQSLARIELEAPHPPAEPIPEVLAENCFLAARDGMHARLVDGPSQRLVPVAVAVETLLGLCAPHAEALGCGAELAAVRVLARDTGADRQRASSHAFNPPHRLVASLAGRFSSRRNGSQAAIGASATRRSLWQTPPAAHWTTTTDRS